MDWGKYVGIPFVFNASSFNGCDCTGLARLVYKEEEWGVSFDDGKPVVKEWYEASPLRLIRYLYRHFDKVDDVALLEPGDVLYYRMNGEGHVAIWIGYGKFLQAFPPIEGKIMRTSHIERFRYVKDTVELYCGFKRRVKDGYINADSSR